MVRFPALLMGDGLVRAVFACKFAEILYNVAESGRLNRFGNAKQSFYLQGVKRAK